MTMGQAKIRTKGLAAGLLFLTVFTMSSAAFAMEPDRDPGRIDLRRPGVLLTQIVWQNRSAFKTSQNRFQTAYIDGLEQRHGRHGEVSRSNLLNSPAARYVTRILTGRRGR